MDPASIAAFGSLLSGAGALGGLFGKKNSAAKQAALEYEYAMKYDHEKWANISEGAKKAGISPLFAIGAPATSFQPSMAFNDGGNKYADAAQGLGRAMDAYGDSKQRSILFEQEARMNELKIQNAEIANATAASDLALRRTAATVPMNPDGAMLIPGQGNSIGFKPSETVASMRGNRGIEAAPTSPAAKYFTHADGARSLYPSPQIAESIEDNIIYQMEHFYRNRIAPMVREAFIDFPQRQGERYGRYVKDRKRYWKKYEGR
jgi:hypothetical protein